MNRISIIGTNGFLSTSIAKHFLSLGWKVNMFGLTEPTGHGYNSFTTVDFSKGKLDVRSLLDSDIIVYASGAGIQSNLKEGANVIFLLNVSVPVEICNDLKRCEYQGTFVSFGSVFEIGEIEERRHFNETDILTSESKAPNDYTVSKRMFTRFVDGYTHDFTHWHFIIPTIYGPSENPLRLIPYTVSSILQGKELHFTSGEQIRQYVFVDEVAELIDLAFSKSLKSGIYGIEGNETISVRELVELIHKSMNKQLPVDCFGSASRQDVGMKFLAIDGAKLFNGCGFKATKRLEDIIPIYIESLK